MENVLFFGLAVCVLSFAVFMEWLMSDKWGPESNVRQDMVIIDEELDTAELKQSLEGCDFGDHVATTGIMNMSKPTQCERHKLYTGWSKPIDPCLACWRRYQERHPDAGVEIQREGGDMTVTYRDGDVVNKVVVPE